MPTLHETEVEIRTALIFRKYYIEDKLESDNNPEFWKPLLDKVEETIKLFDHHTVLNGLKNLEQQEKLQSAPSSR